MEIKTRQIAVCLNDDGEIAGVEARREAVYDDGSRRVLDAEPATRDEFLAILTGEDADLAAALATKVAQLQAAAAINSSLDAEAFGLRGQVAELREAMAAQAERLREAEGEAERATKLAEEAQRAARRAAREDAALAGEVGEVVDAE
jgi:uncharacterized protein YceH (UPF0502 family)